MHSACNLMPIHDGVVLFWAFWGRFRFDPLNSLGPVSPPSGEDRGLRPYRSLWIRQDPCNSSTDGASQVLVLGRLGRGLRPTFRETTSGP